MSVKFLTVFLCVAAGATIGYLIMLSYKRIAVYLAGMCGVIGELKRNMTYRRDSVSAALGKIKVESPLLVKQMREYADYAVGKDGSPAISRGFLSVELYARVCEFFNSLGVSDSVSQTRELDEFGKLFDRLHTDAEQKFKKYGAVAVKLGFLLGLGVGVLTL